MKSTVGAIIIITTLQGDPPRDNYLHPQLVILKNEGSRVQTYRNMNVHVVNTYMLKPI